MRTIFDGLVEEFRAWHLFEQQAGNSPRRELPGLATLGRPDYGVSGYGAGGYNSAGYGPPSFSPPSFGMPTYEEPGSGAAGFGTAGYDAPGYGGADHDRAPRHGRDLGGPAPQAGGRR
jgi:hypothetical protein